MQREIKLQIKTFTRVDQKKIKSHKNNASRECALNFDQWKEFVDHLHSRLVAKIIQTQ